MLVKLLFIVLLITIHGTKNVKQMEKESITLPKPFSSLNKRVQDFLENSKGFEDSLELEVDFYKLQSLKGTKMGCSRAIFHFENQTLNQKFHISLLCTVQDQTRKSEDVKIKFLRSGLNNGWISFVESYGTFYPVLKKDHTIKGVILIGENYSTNQYLLSETIQANARKKIIFEDSRLTTSSMKSPFIRLAFLTPKEKGLKKNSIFGKYHDFKGINEKEDTYYTIENINCRQDCPKIIVSSLNELILQSTKGKCSSLDMVPNSLFAEYKLIVESNSELTYIRKLSSITTAKYTCKDKGEIQMKLSIISRSNQGQNTKLIENSEQILIDTLRALPTDYDGRITGTLRDLETRQLFSSINENIFSNTNAGVFIQDKELDNQQMKKTFQVILESFKPLSTKVPLLYKKIENLLSENNIETYLGQYNVPIKTRLGFLSFVKEKVGIKTINIDQNRIIIEFYIQEYKDSQRLNDDIVLVNKFRRYYPNLPIPIINGTFKSHITTFIQLELNDIKVKEISEFNTNSVTYGTTPFLFDYHYEEDSFTRYEDQDMKTKKNVLEDFKNAYLNKVKPWMLSNTFISKKLPTFEIIFEHVCNGKTIYNIMDELLDHLSRIEIRNIVELAKNIRLFGNSYCSKFGLHIPILFKVEIDKLNKNKLKFFINYSGFENYHLRKFHLLFESTFNQFQGLFHKTIKFELEGTNLIEKSNTFQIKINQKLDGVKASFKYNMETLISNLSIFMNIKTPIEAKVEVNLITSSNLRVHIDIGHLLKLETYKYNLYGIDLNKIITPEYYQNMISKIFSTQENLLSKLNVPYALNYNHNLFKKDIENLKTWLQKKENDDFSLSTLNLDYVVGFSNFNIITKEKIMYSCTINRFTYQNIYQKIEEMNRAFRICKIDGLVHVKIMHQNVVGIFSNILSYLSINSTMILESGSSIPTFSEANSRKSPIYGSNEELIYFMNRFSDYINITPIKDSIDQRLIIPEELRRFYPATFDVILYEITWKHKSIVNNVKIEKELFLQNTTLKLTFDHPELPQVQFGADISMKLGHVFILGLYPNITIKTNVENENQLDQELPNRKNSFNLTFTVEIVKNANERKREIKEIKIIFDKEECRTLRKGLFKCLPEAIPEEYRSIFNINYYEPNSILNSTKQIDITIMRQLNSNGEMIFPIDLSIINSEIIGLNNTTYFLNNAFLISKDWKGNLIFEYQTFSQGLNGSLNIYPLSFSDHLNGKSIFRTGFKQKENHLVLDDLDYLNMNEFSNQFLVDFNIRGKLVIPKVTLKIQQTLQPVNIILQIEKQMTLKNEEDFEKLQREFIQYEVGFEENKIQNLQVYETLSKEDSKTSCTILEKILGKLEEIRSKIINGNIIFISLNFSEKFEETIVNPFRELKNQVCQIIDKYSITNLCKLLNDHWNQEICKDLTISPDGMNVKFNYDGNQVIKHSRLNLTNLLPSLPQIHGSENSIQLKHQLSFQIQIKGEFKNGNIDIKLQDSSVELKLNAELNGNLKVYLGSFPIDLSKTQLKLGSPNIILKAGFNEMNQIKINLSGESLFESDLTFLGESFCSVKIRNRDIKQFLQNPRDSLTFEKQDCNGKSITEAFNNIINKSTFLDAFLDSGVFTNMLKGEFKGLSKDFFKKNIFGKVFRISAHLIQFFLPKLIAKEIENLVGENVLNDIRKRIHDFYLKIKDQVIPREEKEKQGLIIFTKLLCEKLPLSKCPKVPNPNDEVMKWELDIKKDINDLVIPELKLDLGGSFAALKSNLSLLIPSFSFNISLILKFERKRSFYLDWNEKEKIFDAHFDLKVKSYLTGMIGFIGAGIYTNDKSGVNVKLSVEKGWKPNYVLKGNLEGNGHVGYIGKLQELIDDFKSKIEQYPHFQWDYLFTYFQSLNSKTQLELEVKSLKFCLGSYLAKLLETIKLQYFTKFIEPLRSVLDKDGFLLRKVEIFKQLLGRQMSLAEFLDILQRNFCRSRCISKNLFKILQAFEKMLKLLENLKDITKLFIGEGKNLCGAFIKSRSFKYDFRKKELTKMGMETIQNMIDFDNSITGNDREKVRDLFGSLNRKTDWFEFKMKIDENSLPDLFIAYLTKQDKEIFEIQLPPLEIGFQYEWRTLIFHAPPVFIGIEIQAYVKIQPPPLVLTTLPLMKAIENGNPLEAMSALRFRYRNPDGSTPPLIEGSILLRGFCVVSVAIFEGGGYAELSLRARFNFISINDHYYIALDEILKLGKSMEISIDFIASLGLFIRACPVGEGCFTIADIKLTFTFPLYRSNRVKKEPLLDSNGDINDQAIIENDQLKIGDDRISSDPKQPIQSAPINKNKDSLRFRNSKIDKTISILNVGYSNMILPPNSPNTIILVDLDYLPNSNILNIDKGGVYPDQDIQGFILESCKEIKVFNTPYTYFIKIKGITCSGNLEIVELLLEGNPTDYKEIFAKSDGGKMNLKMNADTFIIHSQSITVNDYRFINYYKMSEITIEQTQPILTTITVYEVESHLSITCQNREDKIVIMDFLKTNSIDITGVNRMYVKIIGNSLFHQFYLTPSHIIGFDASNKSTSLNTDQNIRIQNFTYISLPESVTFINQIDRPLSFTDFEIYAADKSIVYYNLSTCTETLYFQLRGDGEINFYISTGGTISSMRCKVNIEGITPNVPNFKVIIDSRNDQVPMLYTFTKGKLSISPRYDQKTIIELIFSNIGRVAVHYSNYKTSQIKLINTEINIEKEFHFPDHYFEDKQTIRACNTGKGSNFMIFGAVRVIFATNEWEECQVRETQNLLENIQSNMNFMGSKTGEMVEIRYINPRDNPQYFKMWDYCLTPTDINRNPLNTLFPPSKWMNETKEMNGISRDNICEILCQKYYCNITIITGIGYDQMYMIDSTAFLLNLHMGNGNNEIFISNTNAILNITVNDGFSVMYFYGPLKQVDVDVLKPKSGVSVLHFYVSRWIRSYQNGIISVVGNSLGSYAKITNFDKKDDIIKIL